MSHWTIIITLIAFISFGAVAQDSGPEDQDAGTDDQSAGRHRVELFEVKVVEEEVGRYNVHLYRNGNFVWRNTNEELMMPQFLDANLQDADEDGVKDVVWWGGSGGSGASSQFYAVFSRGKNKVYWRNYAWKRGQWSNAAGGYTRGHYRCRRNTGKVPKPVKDLLDKLIADPEEGLAVGKPGNYKCRPAKKPGIEWFRKKQRKPTPPDFW